MFIAAATSKHPPPTTLKHDSTAFLSGECGSCTHQCEFISSSVCEWASACCHSAETDSSTWEKPAVTHTGTCSCPSHAESSVELKSTYVETAADVDIHKNQVWWDHRYVLYLLHLHIKTLPLNTHSHVLGARMLHCPMSYKNMCVCVHACVCVFWILLCDLQTHLLERERERQNGVLLIIRQLNIMFLCPLCQEQCQVCVRCVVLLLSLAEPF